MAVLRPSPKKPARSLRSLDSAIILGVRVDIISLSKLLDVIQLVLKSGKKTLIANVNVHAVNLAFENRWFRDLLNDAHIVFCDGMGVKIAGWILGQPVPHRYTPPDWIDSLCEICVAGEYSIYLLGGKRNVAEKMAAKLATKYPKLKIAGTQHGYFDKALESIENKEVVQGINESGTDVLVVGFGMPLQERWLMENWTALEISVALPAGALIDYVAGEVPRMPRWMTDNGFEWLARLVIEPRRLWKRYIIGNPLFFWRVLLQRFGFLKF